MLELRKVLAFDEVSIISSFYLCQNISYAIETNEDERAVEDNQQWKEERRFDDIGEDVSNDDVEVFHDTVTSGKLIP